MIRCCLLALLWIQAPPGASLDTSPFRYSREIVAAPAGLSVLALDIAVLAHSRSDLADLRVVDAGHRQIPYLLEKREEAFRSLLPPLELEQSSQRRSRYRMVLPFEDLPSGKLVLTTPERVFQRSISLSVKRPDRDRRSETGWEFLTSRTWGHRDETTPAADLILDLPGGLGTAEVWVEVDEGDNRPLALGGAHLLMPSYQVRFFYPQDGKLTLYYGQEALSAPRYDLELLTPQMSGMPSQELTVTMERAVPQEGKTANIVLWVALIVAVVTVLALLGRLLRSEKPDLNA